MTIGHHALTGALSIRTGLPCAVLVAVVIGGAAWLFPGWTWEAVKARIRREFPAVRTVQTGELARELAGRGPGPVLLDVRTPEEFAVSHLPGARRVDPGARAEAILPGLPKNAPIVTYCSVGLRSAALAERLQSAGFSNVRNLEGSLFQWANEGRPMAGPSGPAARVHPYNRAWGQLLDKARRAEVVPAK